MFGIAAERVSSDWFGAPAVRVACTFVRARRALEAAAKAYIQTVGRARVRKLRELGAPIAVIKFESDWREVARSLAPIRVGLENSFLLDNMIEAFDIRIDSRVAGRQVKRAPKRSKRPWRLKLAMQSPLPN